MHLTRVHRTNESYWLIFRRTACINQIQPKHHNTAPPKGQHSQLPFHISQPATYLLNSQAKFEIPPKTMCGPNSLSETTTMQREFFKRLLTNIQLIYMAHVNTKNCQTTKIIIIVSSYTKYFHNN